ncbi:MAG TPA: anti-sigma factor [Streptosporangiaceae bacterium]|nr:anti-sigma factor [Streptosporangiaceae bacterium]
MKLLRYDVHALTGAYAVNAIDDEFEREKFERHMHRCQQCASEVRGLTETATRLAFGVSRPPPTRMRDSVLSAISLTRQLPPVIDHRKPRPQHWWTGRLPMLSYSLAMATVGVAIVLLVALIGARHELDQARTQNAALAAVLSAPDSHSVTQTISSGGRVILVYSLRKHAMIVTTHGLPALPSGKVYQLWFIGPPATRSAGLLPASQAGRAGPLLSRGLARGDTIGITIEPAGGTRQPTTKPILLVATHG